MCLTAVGSLLCCYFLFPLCSSQIIGEGALRFFRNGEVDDSKDTTFTSGIVQIYVTGGMWGNICVEDGFGKKEADVICRQLGYSQADMMSPFGTALNFLASFGTDSSPSVINNLSCKNTDIAITQCSFSTTNNSECDDNNDVVVTCDNNTNIQTSSEIKGNIRLVDGLYSNDGLLEVFCGDLWGTVCIEGFSNNAALLACAQLGYNSFRSYSMNSMNTRGLDVPIWYDTSRPLTGCSFSPDIVNMEYCLTNCNLCPETYQNQSSCTHSQDVVLVCDYDSTLPAVNSSTSTVEQCGILNGLDFNTNDETTTSTSETSGSTSIPSISSISETSTPSSMTSTGSTPIPSMSSTSDTSSPSPSITTDTTLTASIIGTIAGSIGGFIIIVILIVLLFLFFTVVMHAKRKESKSPQMRKSDDSPPSHLPTTRSNDYTKPLLTSELLGKPDDYDAKQISQSLSSSMMIKLTDLKVIEKIGQGEFGVVYRGLLTIHKGKEANMTSVAVKTLKGNYSKTQTDELIVEAEKMVHFQHLNVLSLTGVCVGLLESPCIVMPFMSNGSLLSYLRKEAADLTVSASSDENLKLDATKQLLSMCLQVANGMTYLTKHKFVHRDLAARNCMISTDGVIKVADFGLAEDVYTTDYFKQDRSSDESVKLPLKWMALESIHYGKFSEKSDVWSFGVLCWEVFSVGKSPYPGMSPLEVVEMLDAGDRLSKPSNAACNQAIYSLILTCWEQSPDKRPYFSELVERIEKLVAPLADYMDFTNNFAKNLA